MGAETTEAASDIEDVISELEDAIKNDDKKDIIDDKKDIISQEEIFAKTAADHVQKEFLSSQLNNYQVIRRNGKVTTFDTAKISIALTKAFISVEGGTAAASTRIHQAVESLTQTVLNAFTRRMPDGGTLHIEDIQDQVELALMRNGEQKVARAYVLYREERTKERAAEIETNTKTQDEINAVTLNVTRNDGAKKPLDTARLNLIIGEACEGFGETEPEVVIKETQNNLFDGIDEADVGQVLVMSARTLIEKEPNYTYVTAGLLLDQLRQEALTFIEGIKTQATHKEMKERYQDYFKKYIARGAELELLDQELTKYDLEEVLLIEDDKLITFNPLYYLKALEKVAKVESPDIIVFGHTYETRDWVPRLSARLNMPFISDSTNFNFINWKTQMKSSNLRNFRCSSITHFTSPCVNMNRAI